MPSKISQPWQLKAAREKKATDPGVCVYVDNSNIFIEGRKLASSKGEDASYFRLHFDNFFNLMRQGRVVREVVWGGSIPPPTDTVWKHLERLGIIPDLLERVPSGEQGTVDQLVQLRMHRHVRKYRASPGVICLSTGDGAGYYNEEGFLYDVEGFVGDGFKLELYSWSHCCNKRLRQFAERSGSFIPLEDFYESITFVESPPGRGRRQMAVDMDKAKALRGA